MGITIFEVLMLLVMVAIAVGALGLLYVVVRSAAASGVRDALEQQNRHQASRAPHRDD